MRPLSNQRLLLTGLIAVAVVFTVTLSFYHLEDSPRTWFDEGIYLLVAKTLSQKGEFGFQVSPNEYEAMSYISVGYPVLYPLALGFKVFGPSMLSARIFSVLWLACLLLGAFLYVKKRRGIWTGVAVLFLLVTFSPIYGNGKNVLGEIPGLSLVFLSLWMFEIWIRNKEKNYPLVFCGIFAGLAAATKPTFLPFLVILGVGFVVIRVRRQMTISALVIFIISATIPLLIWIGSQFAHDTDWLGVISHYNNPYNSPDPWQNALPNLKRFATESTPIHFALFLILSVLALPAVRKKTSMPDWALLAFSCVVLLSFLKSPGWYRYFFPAHVIFIVLLPVFVSYLSPKENNRRILLVGLVCLVVFQAYHTVTHIDQMYNPAWREVRDIIRATSSPILFYNLPDGAFFSDNANYYQVLTIREGLVYGEGNLSLTDRFDTIITRDGEADLITIKRVAPEFKISDHIGNYHILRK